MDYKIKGPGDKIATVKGTVYLDGKPIESANYDGILWCVDESDSSVLTLPGLAGKKILKIMERDFYMALTLQELGYA